MNINNNVSSNCKKKCEYSFDYPVTNLIARNNGDHITFRPDSQRVSPVRYNQEKFDVKVMKLYVPSIHTFGGSKADAELMIEHVGITSGSRLMVCVPIIASKGMTTLDKLVNEVSKFAPTAGGDAGEISLPRFSIGDIVPMKPYYSYKGSLPNSGIGDLTYDVIIFRKQNALQLSNKGYKKLKTLIKEHQHNVKPKKRKVETFLGHRELSEGFVDKEPKVFFNKTGPTNANGKDEIYIDCQPTGESDELISYNVPNSNNVYEVDDAMNKALSIFIGFAGFFITLLIVFLIYKYSCGSGDTSIELPLRPSTATGPSKLNPYLT